MIQEDKVLLLKDLCSRLPYHCRVFYEYVDDLDNKTYGYSLTLNTWCIDEFNADKAVVKPYLRPMSSMSEEEFAEYEKANDLDTLDSSETLRENMKAKHRVRISKWYHGADWLNKHHFDYRGLIEKGLALEAPKGMYN